MSLFRKILHISADDSPNVRLAKARIAAGYTGPHPTITPGVVSYVDYLRRKATWDPIKWCIRGDGHFYEGAEVLLFPQQWLDRAEEAAVAWACAKRKTTRFMGVDAAEGGDSTVWTVIDELGIIYQYSKKTPDTSEITSRTLALMNEYNVAAVNVLFDRGGGGKQHADSLRQKGHKVRTVGFGEPASEQPVEKAHYMPTSRLREMEEQEVRYVYKNRRAEMYGLTRLQFDPSHNTRGFGMPDHLLELRRQLSPLPLQYDAEGRMYVPPKDKKNPNSEEVTLKQLLGCSPDEADSLVLAVFGMTNQPKKTYAGVAF